jgi:carboxylesterase type B
MQNNVSDPFDLLAHTSYPRIIVSPTYRLNLFGFLCSPTDPDDSSIKSPCPGNFGFWDQRLALEWTHQNISLFSGNPQNITVGGLSAGANSALFQLHHDTYLTQPDHEPMIRRVYLWSNAVGIQPNGPSSKAISSQFDELTSHFNIPPTTSLSEKLASLRTIPAEELVSAIPQMKWHTFRAVTDDDFIPRTFLRSIYHVERRRKNTRQENFSHRLKSHGVKVMLGEVAHESRLYALVNAPSSRADLEMQLKNYYPSTVVDAQLRYYSSLLPPDSSEDGPESRGGGGEQQQCWRGVYARIVADAQVHATVRGLTHALLSSPSPSPPAKLRSDDNDDDDDDDDDGNNEKNYGLDMSDVFRYRISWRAKGLDSWLKPSMGVCHGADAPIWWYSGCRAGYTEEDKRKAALFLEPFGRFICGEAGERGIEWGTETETEKGVRSMGEDGEVKVVGEDEDWERRLEVWDMMRRAQMSGPGDDGI